MTLDGDFITVDNSPQDDHQEQNVQNSTENEDLSFEQEQQLVQQAQTEEEVDYAPTFAQIKRGILTAKSPAHLDVMEEQAMDHADKEERKQLMSLIKAQGQKFQPATEVTAAKKPEPEKEEAPPVETAQVKKLTSAEVKKDYLVRMNKAESVAELNQLHEQFIINDALTGPHLAYLKDAYTQYKAKFNKPAEEEVKEAPKTMRVFVLSDEHVQAITSVLFEAPAKDVIGVINELSSQLSNQAEVIKFIKDAEVQEAKAEA